MKKNKIKPNFLAIEAINLTVMAEFSCNWKVLKQLNIQRLKKLILSSFSTASKHLLVIVDICCNFIALLLCIFVSQWPIFFFLSPPPLYVSSSAGILLILNSIFLTLPEFSVGMVKEWLSL